MYLLKINSVVFVNLWYEFNVIGLLVKWKVSNVKIIYSFQVIVDGQNDFVSFLDDGYIFVDFEFCLFFYWMFYYDGWCLDFFLFYCNVLNRFRKCSDLYELIVMLR